MEKTIAEQLNVKEFPFTIKDSKGNEIYLEFLNSFWIKKEFDSNGNEIYLENSDSFWIKKEFDSNGNMIYYENSNSYWEKREHDENGKTIYYEDSNGYIEDNRNIPEYTMEELEEKIGKFRLKTK